MAPVLLVSACDKRRNARATVRDLRQLGGTDCSRLKGGKDGTLWYSRSLVAVYRPAGHRELIEALGRVVSEMEQLAATF